MNRSIKEHIQSAGLDYDNCLVNLSNSILKKFGAETTESTLAIADEHLAKNYKNVVVILLDALGVSNLEKHLDKDGFLLSNVKHIYSSVYPPTTVAATTSMLSGQYPNEHAWLGWDMYFPGIDKNVTVFRNREQLAEIDGVEPSISEDGKSVWGRDTLMESKPVAEFDAASTYIPYTNILDKINAVNGDVRAYASMPYMDPYPDSFEKILTRIKELCSEPGDKFIYSYWDEPDSTMHRNGTTSDKTHDMFIYLEEKLKDTLSTLSDTLVFITADHGHIDSRNLCILDYPEVLDCLERMPSIEPRTLNLFVRGECKSIFPEIFKRNFGNDFLLLTREEVLTEKVFGPRKDREELRRLIGDFVALAISNRSIFNTHYEAQTMPGVHAGLTVEEMRIPLIVIES